MSAVWSIHRKRRSRVGVALAWLALAVALPAAADETADSVTWPPDPFEIVATRLGPHPFLDAPPPCLPEPVPEVLSSVVPFVLEGDESATRRVLELAEQLSRKEGPLTPELHLWLALLRARVADTPGRRTEVIRAVDRALAWGGHGRVRVCAFLERARAELGNGLAPEASASAAKALEEAEPSAPPALTDGARLIRAEALWLSGREEEAQELFRSLSESEVAGIAVAARLRVRQVRVRSMPPAEGWAALRKALEEAEAARLPLQGFERVAAEQALRAGDTRRALLWIARAADIPGKERATGLATVRKADVLVARGRTEDPWTAFGGASRPVRAHAGAAAAHPSRAFDRARGGTAADPRAGGALTRARSLGVRPRPAAAACAAHTQPRSRARGRRPSGLHRPRRMHRLWSLRTRMSNRGDIL